MRVGQRLAWAGEQLDRDRPAWLAFGLGALIYAALVVWIGRGTTLYVDEYRAYVEDRGADLEALLTPLQGHLELGLRAFYAVLFELLGPDDLLLARVAQIAGAVLAAALLFVAIRRRTSPAVALVAGILLLFLGGAWDVTFVQSGITHTWCLAAGLAALLALERETRGGDLLACALLCVAVVSFTFGLAFALGAGIWALRGPLRWRRLWVSLVPVALYVAWMLWVRIDYVPEYGEVQRFALYDVIEVPSLVVDQAAAVAGVMLGLDTPSGQESLFGEAFTRSPFAAVIALVGVTALVLRLRVRPPSRFLWTAIGVLLLGWVAFSLGIAGGRSGDAARYAYFGTAMVLVVAAEAARGWRPSALGRLALAAVLVFALLGNFARLRAGVEFYRDFSLTLRAQLTALERSRAAVPPEFAPAGGPAGFNMLEAGTYFAAVDRLGSPAFSARELAEQSETVRAGADELLVPALGVAVDQLEDGDRGRPCRRLPTKGAPVELAAGAPGVAIDGAGDAEVSIRRYADTTTQPLGPLPEAAPAAIRLPADGAPRPWTVRIEPTPGSVTACRLAGPG